jgi:DNA-directed RNA polymerase specialized sigma24 family protein
LGAVEQFVNDNYLALKEAAERISGNDPLSEELLHYTLDEFLRKRDVESIVESGGGRFYCVRIMMTQWKSVTSPFYHTYRKPSDDIEIESVGEIPDEEEDITAMADKIREELQLLNWYDRKLFEIFMEENHTISSLARATGIPRTSISLSINRIRKHIKKNL